MNNPFSLPGTAAGTLATAILVVYLFYTVIAGLGMTVITTDQTDEVNSIHSMHLVENCLKNGRDMMNETYLDSVDGRATNILCGTEGFYIQAQVVMYSEQANGVTQKKWNLNSGLTDADITDSKYFIYTNILDKDGNTRIGTVMVKLEGSK